MQIEIRRAYAPPEADDGFRILVDGLWPRGIGKDALKIDAWMKEVAPSPELRRWFGHDPARWDEFRRRYFEELKAKEELIAELLSRAAQGRVTFVFAARDEHFNNAVALRDFLKTHTKRRASS